MDWKVFLASFGTVFLAEMGDKTQLAAMSLTAESHSPLAVLGGACSALFLATGMGVLFGSFLTQWIPEDLLKKAAGAAFIVIGAVILLGKW